VPSERLGPPGRGALRATFVGNDEFTSSTQTIAIERLARVHLSTADTGERKAASPEEGIPIVVTARTTGGVAPFGSVEAIYGDAVVGAAPLVNGAANVVATFASHDENEAELRLRYVPSAPWFIPGDEAIVRVPVKGRSPLRQAPLAIAGLVVVAWLLAGRVKRTTAAPENTAEMPKPAAAPGEARVEIVRSTRDPRAGWSGRVVDAHDGTPVRNARVRIERPGFERAQVVASVHANGMGRFELRMPAGVGVEGFDELVIEGALHAELHQPVPPCGEIEAALVLRKRKLLERLVAWARKQGRPFDSQPEPTPGHVRRAAGADFGTARWADAVERAAYGGADVDARVEAEVGRLAPDPRAAATPGLTVRDIAPGTEGSEPS
jgi:hypothetical protein